MWAANITCIHLLLLSVFEHSTAFDTATVFRNCKQEQAYTYDVSCPQWKLYAKRCSLSQQCHDIGIMHGNITNNADAAEAEALCGHAATPRTLL